MSRTHAELHALLTQKLRSQGYGDVRATYERRRHLYVDLDDLISVGFLSLPVVVAGVQVSLRTLCPQDWLLLRHRASTAMSDRAWREWLLSTSIWMVGGQVLHGDSNAAVHVHRCLKEVPASVLTTLHALYGHLHDRYLTAVTRLESYCYEDASRALWRMAGKSSDGLRAYSGEAGIRNLGLNAVQRAWISYNDMEDDRLLWQREWAAAKMVASATSPKGVQKLSRRDETEQQSEDQRRAEVILRTSGELAQVDGVEVIRHQARTASELDDQMTSYLRGEKDLHDEVVEDYRRRIREGMERQREQHLRRMEEANALYPETGVTAMVSYGQPAPRTGNQHTHTVHDESNVQALYDKYLKPEAVPGQVKIGRDGAPTINQAPRESKPQELDLASRKPTLDGVR